MNFSVLYNDNIIADELNLLNYINEFTKSLGEFDVVTDPDKCRGILLGMRQDFPHKPGLDKASAFKKAANFTAYFIAERPISSAFSSENVGDEIARIRNHQNAVVGFQIAVDSLHGAEIKRERGEIIRLENRICLSRHSYIDIITALHDATPVNHFRMLTVLLEQLAYKSNPDCQYELMDL